MANKPFSWIRLATLVVILTISVFPILPVDAAVIPVTPGADSAAPAENNSNVVALPEFVKAVSDGQKEVVRGVYVDDVMALRVIQQPSGNNGYVSSISGVATQFRMAQSYGTTGLLAHNFAAGKFFSEIELKDVISVVYGDGTIKKFEVKMIQKYQALSPTSATSSFVDLANGDTLSSTKLFEKIYKGEPHLVLQTCIAQDKEMSWGRLFIIADPIED